MITLRFVRSHDAFGEIIGRAELGFWATHVEALAPEEGSWLIGAHIDGGVQKRLKGYDRGKATHELFVELPCTNAQTADFYGFLESQIGKPYDEGAINLLAEGVVHGSETPDNALERPEWICSALQTAALLVAGVVKSAPAGVRLSTPRDVLDMAGMLTTLSEPAPLA